MRLKGDLLHSVTGGELCLLFPIGDGDLLPLPPEDGEEIRGPGAGDPVGIFGADVITGAARESGDDGDIDPGGEADGGLENLVMLAGEGVVGMNGIAVAGERGDLETAGTDGGDELGELAVIGKELWRVCNGRRPGRRRCRSRRNRI